MIRRKVYQLAPGLIAVGGLLLAFVSLKAQLPMFPNWSFSLAVAVGLLAGGLGLLLLVLPIKTSLKIIRRVVDLQERCYEPRIAKSRDIKWIYEFGKSEIGPGADLQKLQDWHNLNRQIFWVIIDREAAGPREKQLVAYYAIFPLNKAATDLVEAEQLDGTSFTNDHIIPFRKNRIQKKPTSLYIGGVAAKKAKHLRRFVMASLIAHLNAQREHGVTTVYTRPVTDDGIRWVERWRFEPVAKYVKGYKKQHIYKYEE